MDTPMLDLDMLVWDTDMVLDMLLSLMLESPTPSTPLLLPLLVSPTPPMLVSAPTTWEPLFPVAARRGRLRPMLRRMLLFSMVPTDTHMLDLDMLVWDMLVLDTDMVLALSMLPTPSSDMLLPTPVLELSILPMSESAPTTSVPRSLARHCYKRP